MASSDNFLALSDASYAISLRANCNHILKGGYFVETDRDSFTIPNPFMNTPRLDNATSKDVTQTRNISTTIFYHLTPQSPVGHFHRNKARTVHTLHSGRGRYFIIHADELDLQDPEASSHPAEARIETFIVGHNIAKGEKLQWIVEGGKFKASYLLPDVGEEESESGLLISETVVPGFDFADHDFLTGETLAKLVGMRGKRFSWMLREEERQKWASLMGMLEKN